ncbi:Metallophosphoesterase [Pacmanvirus A23]|uniref:Metallophosphoesterase n=1 Tax=Pacmanvirus A23 TaxID=1932881 RepID=UPI000A0944BE|nr:Metallophosphoesterase [Pacmanvirus A23]SIP85836.1 Metallophosphoesterase [Pacmanvirus A23]
MFCDFRRKYTKIKPEQPEVIFHVGSNPPPKLDPSHVRCVCIGDTLGVNLSEIKVPSGDILIITGNFTESGDMYDAYEFNKQLAIQPHKYKVVISGENEGQTIKELMRVIMPPNSMFLNGETTILFGVKIICASYIDIDSELNCLDFDKAVDIVISHIPPHDILDSDELGIHRGWKELSHNLKHSPPKVCIFSGCAAGHGARYKNGTLYINCGIYGRESNEYIENTENTEYIEYNEKIKYGVPLTVDICLGK